MKCLMCIDEPAETGDWRPAGGSKTPYEQYLLVMNVCENCWNRLDEVRRLNADVKTVVKPIATIFMDESL